MYKLLKIEFIKTRRSYIRGLALLGIVSPIFLQLLTVGGMRKIPETLVDFNHNIITFFAFFFGSLLVSFIAIFTFYFEYQENTMKNLLIIPYKKSKILLAKLFYILLFTVILFVIGFIVDIFLTLTLGVDVSAEMICRYIFMFVLMAILFYILVPLMSLLTLLFRGFIVPMLIAIVGSLAGAVALGADKYYLVPWAIPGKILISLQQNTVINLTPGILAAAVFFIITSTTLYIYFLKLYQG